MYTYDRISFRLLYRMLIQLRQQVLERLRGGQSSSLPKVLVISESATTSEHTVAHAQIRLSISPAPRIFKTRIFSLAGMSPCNFFNNPLCLWKCDLRVTPLYSKKKECVIRRCFLDIEHLKTRTRFDSKCHRLG